MQQRQKNYYKNLLMEERKDLLKELQRFTDEEHLSLKESDGELSSYDNHPGDQASSTYEREKDTGLRDNTLRLLEMVNSALYLLKNDKYGICERCDKEIDGERLEAIPYTNLCRECSSEEEIFAPTGDRPLEEEVLGPPFGRSFLDDSDSVEYDGEDTWQDVAQYGTSQTIQDVPEATEGPGREAYIDSDEIIGSTGDEDSVYNEEVETLNQAAEEEYTATGEKGDNRR